MREVRGSNRLGGGIHYFSLSICVYVFEPTINRRAADVLCSLQGGVRVGEDGERERGESGDFYRYIIYTFIYFHIFLYTFI